jgi:hypothetical protein
MSFAKLILHRQEIEDTKELIRIREFPNNTMTKRKRTKGPATIYKTLHRFYRSSNSNSTKHRGRGVNSSAPEG